MAERVRSMSGFGGREDDPQKHVPVKVGIDTGFAKRSCEIKDIERISDSMDPDFALGSSKNESRKVCVLGEVANILAHISLIDGYFFPGSVRGFKANVVEDTLHHCH